MPILPTEPDFYPPDLWEDPTVIHKVKDEGVWWCLHTKPRQEKALARDFHKEGRVYYLPQVIKEDRTPQGRKIRSVIPLFPSYLFLHGDLLDRMAALQGNRLVNVLEVRDQSSLEHDLRQIHKMLGSGVPVVPEPHMPLGAKVRIKNGPLAGVEGIVVRRGNRDHLVAVVQFLGRGADVALQDWQVERVVEA